MSTHSSKHHLSAARRRPFAAFVPLSALLLVAGWALTPSNQLRAADPIPVGQAIDELLSRLSSTPDADAYNDLGNLYDLAGDMQRAEEAYRQALEWNAEHTDALYNLGLVLQRQHRWKEAGRLFQRVIDHEPNAAWAHFQLGMSRHERGNQRGAIRAFVTAFELDSSLAFPDVNPQLLDNDSATIALLQRSSSATGNSAPRRYAQPQRTASLLIGPEPTPEVLADPADQAETTTADDARLATAQPATRRRSKAAEQVNVSASSSGDEALPTAGISERSRDLARQEQEEQSSAGRSEQRVIGATSLRGNGGRSGSGSAQSSRPATTSSPNGRSVARPSSSRFRPGRRSNARIDWELSPVPSIDAATHLAAPAR